MPDLTIGLLLIAVPGFVVGVAAALVAGRKGRSRLGWFLISYLGPLLSFFAVGVLESVANWGGLLRFLWFGSYFVPLYLLWQLPTRRRYAIGRNDQGASSTLPHR
ncbi:MAG: hypothetical protein QGG58_09965 [Chloroflexota bacterium]|nr:hypothetical protein [Chloroflexota bacterium]